MNGILGISGKAFTCEMGESLEDIFKANPHLTSDEVNEVYDITRITQSEDFTHIDLQ